MTAPVGRGAVVATAGHVDHGKSTLVRALTGIDPDRFAEEQERGLTIDLGFASAPLPSGRLLSFVDVPGHVRFIANMLAGVGAVDACLFVVAATEGWKPQSEEHLRILELVGVTHGTVALTKVALVDDDRRTGAADELRAAVSGTFLADAPVVEVDAPSGSGVDELRDALDDMLAATPTAPDRGLSRLWVDRSFAARGSGTVVTGTLTGGALRVGDDVVFEPGSRPARVRGLQRHHESAPAVGPGNRLAVNVAGVGHDEVRRGDALVRPDTWHLTRTLDAALSVLPGLGHEVTRRGAYQAHIGSGRQAAQVRVLGAERVRAGETGLVRVHLSGAVPLLPGDRYVLRDSGRNETVGGGEVLDVSPVLPAAKARPDRSVERVVAERGWVDTADLRRLTGEDRSPDVGRWVVAPAARAAAERDLRDRVTAAGPVGLATSELDDFGRALVGAMDGVEVVGGRARPAGARDELAEHWYVQALEAEPFSPPPAAEVDPAELRELVRRGLVVGGDGVWFSAGAVEQAAAVVSDLLAGRPEGVTVADVRDALGTTRKHAVPLLVLLDGRGVTRRRGDRRFPGPRAPRPDATP